MFGLTGPEIAEIFGYIATFLITICYIPQVSHTYKTKDVSGISLITFSTLAVGVFMWTVYSFILWLPPFIICNVVSLGMIMSIVIMKIMYSKRPLSEVVAADAEHIAQDVTPETGSKGEDAA